MDAGDIAAARRDFDLALAGDGRLVAALAGRAILAYEAGDHESAISDLTLAIEVTPDPDLLYNRGMVQQEAARWQAAIDDFTRALDLPGADRDEISRQREICRIQLSRLQAGPQDPADRGDPVGLVIAAGTENAGHPADSAATR